ncbi:MAG: RHS repeat-associated core domain-containing protein [Pseudomonadota bacterium]
MSTRQNLRLSMVGAACIIMLAGFFSIVQSASLQDHQNDRTFEKTTPSLAWKFEYDDLGLMKSVTRPGGAETKISYKIDESKHFIKQVRRQDSDSSEVVYEYDSFARRVQMIDSIGTVRYGYDKAGHLAVINRDGYPSISYTYDTMDRMTSMSIDDEFTVKYIYDFLGRLSKIETSAGEISYDYQTSQGIVIRTLPNGIRTNWINRPDGKLAEISHVQKNNNVITQFKYDYRADGLIGGMSHWDSRWGNKKTEFEYDNVQRLTKANDSSGKKVEYQYDKLGNRTALIENGQKKNVSKYNWAGQMVSHNGQACTHDADGNLTSLTGNNGPYNFEYNTTGSVKSIKLNDASVNYQYDGDGYLIARTTGNKKTLFVPDPLTDNFSPLIAIDSDGKKTFYIWDGQTPLMAINGNDAKFFLNDHLGSVRCVVDKMGQIINQYDFSPFGVSEQNITGNDLTPGYAGLFFDGSISMYLTHARVYDPQTGQFLQTDPQHRIPSGSQKDLSQYVYCGGDPVNFVDRNGAEPELLMLTDGMGNAVSGLSYPMIAISKKQSKWPHYPGDTPDTAYLQVTDAGIHRDWLVKTLEQYEKKAMIKNPHVNDRAAIRQEAVNKFSKDYSMYPSHEPSKKNSRAYNIHIGNMNIATDLGLVNVDWLTTVISLGFRHGPVEYVTSMLSPKHRYYLGKTLNNIFFKPIGKGPRTDWSNAYPETNLNALRVIKERIYNPDIPFSQVFQPPSQVFRPSVSVKDLETRMQEIVSKELNTNTAYLKCWQWQDLVYHALATNKDVAKDWEVIPYGRVDEDYVRGGNKKQTVYDHFFVVVKSRQDGSMYKIDPWPGYISGFTDEAKRSIVHHFVGHINPDYSYSKIEPFKPEEKYVDYIWGNLDMGDDKFARFPHEKRQFVPPYQPASKQLSSGIDAQRLQQSRELADVIMQQMGAANRVIKKYDISGGDWRVAGPGGMASLDADAALSEFKRISSTKTYKISHADIYLNHIEPPKPSYQRKRFEYLSPILASFWGGGGPPGPGGGGGGISPMSPSNVGGVYLKNAGKALEHLGPLKGIAVDDKQGKLVLLSEDKGSIGLPPLRIDDVVTVFKSVYELGESPFVSIDPKPEDPKGPIMNIRHGKGTEETYVGWVLFETDRIMKGYSLGVDNITREKIDSKIEDYKSIFDMSANGENNQENGDSIWERFWIVPAEVNARQTDNKELTLFDVPLKVNTQRMKMQKGKLVPADDDTPTENAKTFSDWFTARYDQISAEFTSKPPSDSGIDKTVESFSELRRVAVITAIAESLRDQGVPMPAWMRDYPVRPCKMTKTTPAIRIEEKQKTVNGNKIVTRTNQMYGGVNLAADKKDVHIVKADQKEETFANEVQKKVAAIPVLTPVKLTSDNKEYNIVALPGNDTLDIGANQLTETDLAVPVLRGMDISIVRKYNSFFAPDNEFGVGWTLDLPRLEERRQPSHRSSDVVSIGYQLTSPLNTYSELFRVRKDASGAESKSLLPKKQDIFRSVAQMDDKKIGFKTTVLMFQDGRQWHFDGSGYLVAQVDNPLTVVYRRTGSHQITRIEGWYGKDLYADIKLNYDKYGRMISAKGSNEINVEYEYGSSGKLKNVALISEKKSDNQKLQKDIIDYEYTDGFVTSIAWNGENIRQFKYGDRGKLASEQGAGSKLDYRVSHIADGIKIVSKNGNDSKTAVYDNKFRPVEKEAWDGTTIKWNYDDPAVTKLAFTQPGGEQYFVENTTDGKRSTLQTPGGDEYIVEYNDAGRPIRLGQDGRQLIKQKWHPNGLLASTTRETGVIRPQYSKDNVLTDVLITPQSDGSSFKEWAKIKYDILGQPTTITDYRGSKMDLGYDKHGRVSIAQTKQGGVQIKRDKEDRVKEIKTSWGYHQNNAYDSKSGHLEEVTLTSNKQKAKVQFDDKGRLTELQQFDKGVTNIFYYDESGYDHQVRQIKTPNDIALNYDYDPDGRLAKINCDGAYELKYDYDDFGRLISLAQVSVSD